MFFDYKLPVLNLPEEQPDKKGKIINKDNKETEGSRLNVVDFLPSRTTCKNKLLKVYNT